VSTEQAKKDAMQCNEREREDENLLDVLKNYN